MYAIHTGCGARIDLEAPREVEATKCGTGDLWEARPEPDELIKACARCMFGDKPASVVGGPAAEFTPPTPDETAIAAGYQGYTPVETHPEPLEPIVTPAEVAKQLDPPRIDRYPGLHDDQATFDQMIADGERDILLAKAPPKLMPLEELLKATVPHWTPGGSVFGWSKVKVAKLCLRRFYWEYVRQLRKKAPEEEYVDAKGGKRVNALELGTMVHLVIETIYRTGSLDEGWKVIDIVKGSRPELALETRRLVNFYVRRFNKEEVESWDLRAVETESRYYFPARKVRGKRRSCCMSSRHDHLYRKTKHGAKLPPGTVADDGEMRVHELKCLDANEFLWDARSDQRATAGELLAAHVTPLLPTFNLDTEKADVNVAHLEDNGVVPVYEITLSSGRKALLTDNHPVWTSHGWVVAKKLQLNDCVACAPPVFNGTDRLEDTEVELLGYFLGDGYLGEKSVTFSTGRPDLMKRVCTLLKNLGNAYSISHAKDHVPSCRISLKGPFVELLTRLKLRGSLAGTKFVPGQILGATETQLRVFLAALWSTDGHVGMHKKSRTSLEIHYDTMSSQLARDTQQLLWRCGIWSTNHSIVVQYKNRGERSNCVKVATQRAKRKFIEDIFTLMIPRKKMRVDDALKYIPHNNKDKADFLPTELVRQALPHNLPERFSPRFLQDATGVCRNLVADVVKLADAFTALRRLSESKLQWDKVVSKKYLGKRRSVAVSVPDQPVFLTGDGLVTHNTTASLNAHRIRAFYVDAQVMLHLLTYNHGHFVDHHGEVLAPATADVFGRTNTITVTNVGKKKAEDPQEDIARLDYDIPEPRVLAFRDDVADWFYEEVLDRLYSDDWLDHRTWRKDWLCKDIHMPGWMCPYAPICTANSDQWDQLYEQPKGDFDRTLLELPPKLAKLAAEKAAAVASVEGK